MHEIIIYWVMIIILWEYFKYIIKIWDEIILS